MPDRITCTIFVGTSVDGFIAREDHSLDWLPIPDPEEHGYTAFLATVDAIVIGRNTFEVVLRHPQWPYSKPVVVLSSRPWSGTLPTGAAVELMAGTPAEIVARLGARGMKHLYVDGGVTIQRFLEAGLIDRMVITRVPVVIGTGIPLFGPTTRDVHLEHVATRALAGGLVTSEYRVLKGPAPRVGDVAREDGVASRGVSG